jgi:predicted acyltransferase
MPIQKINNPRLISLDALRGFDMVWLLGASSIFSVLYAETNSKLWLTISKQFEHSVWHGITFYDVIFPVFIFLSGVTLGISNKNFTELSNSIKKVKYKKAVIRLFLLSFLGVIYNHGWGQGIPVALDEIRYASVLMRIGLAWFFCAMIIWHFSLKSQLLICIGVLIGYWVLLMLIPTPEGIIGELTQSGSWNSWIDRHFLPGITYRSLSTDPEGLLSQIPAVISALSGAFAGKILSMDKQTKKQRLVYLLFASFTSLLLGYLWGFSFPINKVLWTSSFVLFTSGCSGLLLCLFYWLFDMLGYRKAGCFFAVIGANSILFYLLSSMFDWMFLVKSFAGGLSRILSENYFSLALILLSLLLQWTLAHFLYSRKILIKI